MYSKQARINFLKSRQTFSFAGQALTKAITLALLMLSLNACSTSYVLEYIEEEGNKSGNWVHVHNGKETKIVAKQVDGPIVMNDAETDVLAFPANASIFVSIQGDENLEMEVKREGQGDMRADYKVDGVKRIREQMTDAQLNTLWRHFFRRSGLSIEDRSARIFKNEGLEGLLIEITQLKSNAVTRRYLDNLSQNYEMNERQFDKALQIIADISSNSESSRAYKSLLKGKTTLSEVQLVTLIEQSSTISSNSTLSNLLSDMLDMNIPAAQTSNGRLTQRFTESLLKASTEISSNSQLASFLESLIEKVDDQDVLASIIVVAKENISSDSTLSELYEEISEMKLSESNTRLLIESAAQEIASDSTLADLFDEINETQLSEANVRLLIESAGAEIASDSTLSELYEEINERNLSTENTRALVRIASTSISSDSNLASLLIEIAISKNYSPTLLDGLMEASKSIGSSSRREKLLETLVVLK